MKKLVVSLLLTICLLTFGAVPAMAQPGPRRISPTPKTTTAPVTANVCDFAGDKKDQCSRCMVNGTGTWTAIGCISSDPANFITQILRIGVSIGGGIAFLLILFGGFQILTSSGNPEQMNEGRELISSAITGLLLIIFSIFLLRLIGYNILGIPGFG